MCVCVCVCTCIMLKFLWLRGGPISGMYGPGENDVVIESVFGKRFICCALTIVYSIYNTVGQSVSSIYNLGTLVNMSPRSHILDMDLSTVPYILYGMRTGGCGWYECA